MKNSAGFSLIELLVASTLSLLVISGLMTVYLSIKSNNNLQQALIDLQEAGGFALQLLNQRLRIAGFVGCEDSLDPINQELAIIGYDSQHLPNELKNQVIPGTDVVVINSCENNSTISKNSQVVQMAYYIGDTNRQNSQGKKILALFQKPLDSERIELVAGIEQMQILYGLEAQTAAQVENWQNIHGVQIDLLVNSIEPILKRPQSYYFHHQTIQPQDLLLHKPWSTYITLRDRAWL